MAGVGGVAVVGSVNADLAAYGSPLPRPGETVVAADFAMTLGGKGANQALAAARAGAETYFVGAVGDDIFRELTLGALTNEGVDTSAVRVLDGHTGIAHIRVDTTTGQNDIAYIPNANHRIAVADAEQALRGLADRIRVVLVQLEIPIPIIEAVAKVCRELDLQLIIDPAPAHPLPEEIWPGVFVVKPNEFEAEILTGTAVTDQASAVRAGNWFLERGVGTALITLGERGVLVVNGEGAQAFSAFSVRPVDTTAAGDAFAGGLAAALAQQRPWSEAVRRALAAGALAVTVRGASPSLPTAAQIDAFLAAR
jgi:ribokinase